MADAAAARRLCAFKRWMRTHGVVCSDALNLDVFDPLGVHARAATPSACTIASMPVAHILGVYDRLLADRLRWEGDRRHGAAQELHHRSHPSEASRHGWPWVTSSTAETHSLSSLLLLLSLLHLSSTLLPPALAAPPPSPTPTEHDEAAQSEVGDEVSGGEREHGGRAGGVAGVEPTLDGGALVGDAGAEAIAESGGASSVVLRDGMMRAPAVRFPSARRAAELKVFLEDPANFDILAVVFNS